MKEIIQDVKDFLKDLTDVNASEAFGIFFLGPSIFMGIVILIGSIL